MSGAELWGRPVVCLIFCSSCSGALSDPQRVHTSCSGIWRGGNEQRAGERGAGFCGGSHLGNSGNLQRRSCCGANDTRVCVLQASLTCILFCCFFFYVTAESIQTLDEPMCSVSLRISLRTRKQLSLRKTSLLCLLSCVSSIDRVQAKVKRVTRV